MCMCAAGLQCYLVLWMAKVFNDPACTGDYGSLISESIESTPRGCDADEMVCVCVCVCVSRTLCMYVDGTGVTRSRMRV